MPNYTPNSSANTVPVGVSTLTASANCRTMIPIGIRAGGSATTFIVDYVMDADGSAAAATCKVEIRADGVAALTVGGETARPIAKCVNTLNYTLFAISPPG